jgi:hypothetical protein
MCNSRLKRYDHMAMPCPTWQNIPTRASENDFHGSERQFALFFKVSRLTPAATIKINLKT